MQVVIDPITNSKDWLMQVSTRKAMTRESYRAFCAANPDLRIELSSEGELIVMAPAHSRSGARNALFTLQLGTWALQDGTGEFFDSSAGFDLPNGSNRAPDASWVLKSRIDALPPEQCMEFMALCPDFVAELRSSSDRLPVPQAKMQEYMACGAKLGWLIDPLQRRVWVYRPGVEVELLDDPATVTAGSLMPGFVLDLAPIWKTRQ
jgi:Uma2 family endonuclease